MRSSRVNAVRFPISVRMIPNSKITASATPCGGVEHLVISVWPVIRPQCTACHFLDTESGYLKLLWPADSRPEIQTPFQSMLEHQATQVSEVGCIPGCFGSHDFDCRRRGSKVRVRGAGYPLICVLRSFRPKQQSQGSETGRQAPLLPKVSEPVVVEPLARSLFSLRTDQKLQSFSRFSPRHNAYSAIVHDISNH